MKMATTFYRRVIVFSRPIDESLPQIHSSFQIKITPLQDKDLPDYHRLRPEQPPRMIRKRIADGDQCFLVWSEGRIVHSGWVATQKKSDPYLRCTLILQPGEIFLYDHYTHPSYRSHGLAQARDIYLLQRYRQEGYRRSIAVVAIENKPAFRPFEAIGYRPIGMFRSLWWILGKTIWQQQWGKEQLPVVAKWKHKGPSDDHSCSK